MPILTINILEGRDDDTKKELIKNVTETIVKTLDVPVESVRVMINELPFSHYGVAGLPVKEYRLKKIKEDIT